MRRRNAEAQEGKGLEDQMESEKRWYEQMQPERQETANAEGKGWIEKKTGWFKISGSKMSTSVDGAR